VVEVVVDGGASVVVVVVVVELVVVVVGATVVVVLVVVVLVVVVVVVVGVGPVTVIVTSFDQPEYRGSVSLSARTLKTYSSPRPPVSAI